MQNSKSIRHAFAVRFCKENLKNLICRQKTQLRDVRTKRGSGWCRPPAPNRTDNEISSPEEQPLLQGVRLSRDTGLVPATSEDLASGAVLPVGIAGNGAVQLGRIAERQVRDAPSSQALRFQVSAWSNHAAL